MELWLIAMDRNEARKALGRRLKQLRKLKGWTQKDLASKVDVRYAQLNKYEGGIHAPPIDKLVQLAEVLDTSVDYLLAGDRSEPVPLRSTRLLDRFRQLEELEANDQDALITMLDAFILMQKVEGTLRRSSV